MEDKKPPDSNCSKMGSKLLERVDEFFTVEGLKQNWALVSLVFIFLLAVWLRYLPEQSLTYLQALDPYVLFRNSQHFALDGIIPRLDFFKYFPYPHPNYQHQIGPIVFPAILYWLGPFLFFPSYLEWAQFFPALMGGLSVVFTYLLGKEIFDRKAGVAAAFFLATIAGSMHRTSAGFFEKEPIGTFLMMVSLYFFARAWRRDEWLSGIASGLALGFFTVSWGGSRMLWLLYPLTTGTVLMIDEDVRSLVRSYTPTVLVGGGTAMALHPTSFWIGSSLALANLALVGLMWSRHLVEELELLEQENLRYYVPTVSIAGLVFLAVSPLVTDVFMKKAMRIYSTATQSSPAVISGTVAENTAAGLGQIISQLGSTSAAGVNQTLGMFSYLVGTWPLAFIGIAMLGTSILLMAGRKYGLAGDSISTTRYYKLFSAVFLAWILAFALFFKDSVVFAVAPAVLVAAAGMAASYSFGGEEMLDIEFRWYYLLPFFWVVSNVLGAVTKSRLVFLASFPVAFTAGYAFSRAVDRLNSIDYSQFDEENADKVKTAVIASVIVLAAAVSGASGYTAASSMGGSPSQAWMQSLDYMNDGTEPGSVIMSWWDYGYWFESIGRRPSIADGLNAGYYSEQTSRTSGKVNYPLADFFTSPAPENHTDFFRKHSVDYVVLDNTMIGKYSAVSQIAHRDNSNFRFMRTIGTSNLQRSLSTSGNRTIAQFSGRGLTIFTPLETGDSGAEISGPPVLEAQGVRREIGCILTDSGVRDFPQVEEPVELATGSRNGRTRTGQVCIAEDPFYSLDRGLQGGRAKIVIVPREIADHSLVRLYLMDGYGIDYLEKVPEASNGYVKMWKVEGIQ